MALDKITFNWDNSFNGTMHTPRGDIKVGKNDIQPYNLLLGALGSCFYATLVSIAEKMRLTFNKATLELNGNKREESPTTLENVKMELRVWGVDNQSKFDKAVILASENCSIHETIKKVAKIEVITIYE
ncbi:MAG: OsmC family protein [Bacilli bacterium]